MTLLETELYIKEIKDFFESSLSKNLNLYRVTAPVFLKSKDKLNDELSGLEQPVTFEVSGEKLEIIHSLAKWKRHAIELYNIPLYKGLYTDMNAIRKDDDIDAIHSIYVDQWDWELHIDKKDRTISFLKSIVKKIYQSFLETSKYLETNFNIKKKLNSEIFFITSQELEDLYPNLTSKEREYKITKEKTTVFIIGIGDKLKSGISHDVRSYDYDDWTLNGDLLVYYEKLDIALELSSMGIRVDKASLLRQASIKNKELSSRYHQNILNEVSCYTIGGGIGQSRMCMYFLDKEHIGEVQNSYWPKEEVEKYKHLKLEK
ncbi:Aspartate--ammonia ligase (Asparagine synthetase A) [Alteracholeplasma palmae J233]|uniref:Aspartate--ammonia ligase (Asparagine synthetase A) n=1 Tax=Alteracholeplasma palmae (strain ATCC 49389 / J233) TaxID=1318466 RepID=U4KKY3_ALTPJ|nr:aspartate--ammonia ligase [Alteracholeplasma palmae]CCV64484.1 Aspartate--ammonia ligase (Asparagine synthetase A) [Alteracholeplasma palmae J233]